jgi:hypothetical protein
VDVEKHQIGTFGENAFDGLATARRFSGDLDVAFLLQKSKNLTTRRRFVVDDKHAH